MRLFLATLIAFTSVLPLIGCKKETPPDVTITDDRPATQTGSSAVSNPAAGGATQGGQQLPPGVQAKDVPGMGAPPPAGSDAANQPPAGGAIRQ